MQGKKISQNIDENLKVKLEGGASVNLMPTYVYRIDPQVFYEDGKPRLEEFAKTWTNLAACRGRIIKLIGVKAVTKRGEDQLCD